MQALTVQQTAVGLLKTRC